MALNPPTQTVQDEIDPITGQKKKTIGKPVQYPYLNPTAGSSQIITPTAQNQPGMAATAPYTPPAQTPATTVPATAAGTAQGNIDVLAKAQTDVLQGNQNAISPLIQQQTANLLQNPTLGYDPQNKIAQELAARDRQRAQAFEALKQQTADVGNTGANLERLFQKKAEDLQGRNEAKQQLEEEAFKTQQDAIIKALNEGRLTEKQAADLTTQGIGNLATVRGMKEGEAGRETAVTLKQMDIEGQTALTKLQADIDDKKLIKTQDFAAAEAGLDRALKLAIQQNDTAAQVQITQLQADLDAKKQTAAQNWQTSERIATQAYSTTERLSQNDYNKGMEYIKSELASAEADKDVGRQKELLSTKNMLDMKFQTAGFDHDSKMKYLDTELANARADKDVAREKDVLTFKHAQEIDTLTKAGKIDEAKAYLAAELQKSINNNDFANTQVLQKATMKFDADEKAKDRAIQQLSIEVQKSGQDFNKIMELVKNGNITVDAAVAAIKASVPKDVADSISTIDPEAATKKQIDILYNNTLYAWSKSMATEHPEYIDKTKDTGVSDAGMAAYNKYFNETAYPNSKASIENVINGVYDTAKLRGASSPDSKNHADYANLLNSTKEWTASTRIEGNGFWNPDVGVFNNPPAQGEMIKSNGKLYKVMTTVSEETRGENYQHFTVMDVDTGENIEVKAQNTGITGIITKAING